MARPGGCALPTSDLGPKALAVLRHPLPASLSAAESKPNFEKDVLPILKNYCYDCHADGEKKGNVVFDEFKSDNALLGSHDLWLGVLKNMRAGLMPPKKKSNSRSPKCRNSTNGTKLKYRRCLKAFRKKRSRTKTFLMN